MVAVHGHDGCGKTSVLHEVANDVMIRSTFTDGIFMLRLGRDPELTALQATLLQLRGELRPFHGEGEATDLLAQNFGKLRALIILDDVMSPDDVRAFVGCVSACAGCRLLLAAPVPRILEQVGVAPGCVFGARPAQPQLLLETLQSVGVWKDKLRASVDTEQQDEEGRCLELAYHCHGVQLVIRTVSAHVAAGANTANLCKQVQLAKMTRLARLAVQWEADAGEDFDNANPTVERMARGSRGDPFRGSLGSSPPTMPDSEDEDDGSERNLPPTPRDGPEMPASDSDDEGAGGHHGRMSLAPPLPPHSDEEDLFEPEPEPEAVAFSGYKKREKLAGLTESEKILSEMLLQGSFDVLSACFATLDDTVQRRCAELAAFPQAVPVPLVMLSRIWSRHGMDDFATDHLLKFLAARGWVQLCGFENGETYAIAVHPIITDFLMVWWSAHSEEINPAVASHQHLLQEWGRSNEQVGWGSDGGYWLRHMMRHFRGAGFEYRRLAMCAVFSIHWLESKMGLCRAQAVAKDLNAAIDHSAYDPASLLQVTPSPIFLCLQHEIIYPWFMRIVY